MVAATPAGYRERRAWRRSTAARAETPPSFAGNRIYLRNDEEPVAVEVS